MGVGPLRWDDGLAAYAQQWTDHLAADGCRMKHRQSRTYGENLYQGTAGHYTAVDAAKAWESEKTLYGGSVITEKNYGRIGHYTQMVWRDTRGVGCAVQHCERGAPFGSGPWTLVVCNYEPPGNVVGRKPY